jgi:hypothetical protein
LKISSEKSHDPLTMADLPLEWRAAAATARAYFPRKFVPVSSR